MFLVKTRAGLSKIHGMGVFADEFIKKGKIIWRFTPGIDVRMTEQELRQIKFPSNAAKEFFLSHAFKSKKTGMIIHCADHAMFYNNAEHPNTLSVEIKGEEEAVVKALENIRKGEELTDN